MFFGEKHLSFPPTKQLIKRGGVTYSTDVTCLSWVGGKVPSYGEWKAGHQEEGLYCIYIDDKKLNVPVF